MGCKRGFMDETDRFYDLLPAAEIDKDHSKQQLFQNSFWKAEKITWQNCVTDVLTGQHH